MALVGCGGIARGHIDAYRGMAGRVDLAVCVDVDEAKARAFAQRAGCRWATDYESILGSVDAVDICTPPHLHAPMAIAAASRGKHVLTEKVMATTLEDADRMIGAAEAAGVVLMVAYVTRFDPIWLRLHQEVERGTVGRAYMVSCRTEHAPELAPWRAAWDTFPMGALLSHGCHYVDQMIWNFGDIVSATSVGSNTVRGPGIAREDTAAALFRFGNGMLGNLVVSWAATHTNHYIEFNVYGTDAFLHLAYEPGGARRLEVYRNRGGTLDVEALHVHDPSSSRDGDGPKNFAGECEHFVECIETGRAPLTGGRESRRSMEAILAAYQGDDEDRIVDVAPGATYAARPGTRSTASVGVDR